MTISGGIEWGGLKLLSTDVWLGGTLALAQIRTLLQPVTVNNLSEVNTGAQRGHNRWYNMLENVIAIQDHNLNIQ